LLYNYPININNPFYKSRSLIDLQYFTELKLKLENTSPNV